MMMCYRSRVTKITVQCEKKGRVVQRSEGIPVKKPELTERSRIMRPFFGKFRQVMNSNMMIGTIHAPGNSNQMSRSLAFLLQSGLLKYFKYFSSPYALINEVIPSSTLLRAGSCYGNCRPDWDISLRIPRKYFVCADAGVFYLQRHRLYALAE